MAHAVRDLGIHKEALRSWARHAEADAGERDDRTSAVDRDLHVWDAVCRR
ncbi:hypothetical protein [Streptomyces pimonensis]